MQGEGFKGSKVGKKRENEGKKRNKEEKQSQGATESRH